MTRSITQRLGRPVTLELVHDGTAAAASVDVSDGRRAAVITWGTALGIGYPQAGSGLRRLAPDFSVDDGPAFGR